MERFNVSDIEENFKRGLMEMIILQSLCEKDLYGYEMTDFINAKSDGKINLKEGSLYGSLYRLIDKNCISENKVLVGKRRTRIYFHIEQIGRDYLQQMIDVYTRMHEGVMMVIGEETENGQKQ